jgi:DNA polymerase-3 subunit delta
MPKAKAVRASNITAVVGSDEGTVKARARELARELSPAEAGEFGVEIIDGAADNAAGGAARIHETINALQTLPFFGGKLVWLKSANVLADTPIGRSNGVLEALEALLGVLQAGLPPDVQFLLSATEVDKRRTFYKGLSKVAELQVFDRLDASRSGWEEEAAGIVSMRARALDLDLAGEARDLFTLLTGGDTRQIDNELEKLDLYLGAGARQVDVATVRALVPMSRAGVIFELGNAISRRDADTALGLVGQLLFQGESAIGLLLVAMVPTVRNLLLVKDLQTRFRLPRPNMPFGFGKALERLAPEATAHLPRKKDGTVNTFGLGFAAMEAHRFELDELRRGMAVCLRANTQLVTSQLEPRLVLERAILELING